MENLNEDQTLLKLAAKAAGYRIKVWKESGPVVWVDDCPWIWNPLENDAYALQLAHKCRISLMFAETDPMVPEVCFWHGEDWKYLSDACYRRAIVKAAAEIGMTLP